MAGLVSRRGLLGSAALVGAGALAGVVQSAGTAAADAPLDTPFTPVTVPHLAEAERMVQYQRMLAAGHLPGGLAARAAATRSPSAPARPGPRCGPAAS
jgi:hypothetical protein